MGVCRNRANDKGCAMRRRVLLPLVWIGALAFSLAPIGASAASQKDACKDRGYQTLVQSDGASFKNQGECVAYAVRGGTLVRGLDASSVFTGLRGAGGPPGPPDANGDSTGGGFDSGVITGAFSGAPPDGFNFVMFLNYVLHRPTGVAEGTGTALCDPCLVGGLTGTVSFTTTVIGHAIEFDGMTFVAYDSGTWQINAATGDLAAISGSGTWTQGAGNVRMFAGTIVLPI